MITIGFFIQTKGGERTLVMDDSFFVGYRRTALKPTEVLKGVLIPYTQEVGEAYQITSCQVKDEECRLCICLKLIL